MALLRALAAKVLLALERETEDAFGSAIVSNEERTVIVLSHRNAPGTLTTTTLPGIADELIRLLEAIRDRPREQPTRTVQSNTPILRTAHQRVLEVLGPEPQTAKAISRRAGYSPNSSHVRQALADLVTHGLACHIDGGGYVLVSDSRAQESRVDPTQPRL